MLFDCRRIQRQQIARRGQSQMSSIALFTAGMYWTGLGRQITPGPLCAVPNATPRATVPIVVVLSHGRLLAAVQSSRVSTQRILYFNGQSALCARMRQE